MRNDTRDRKGLTLWSDDQMREGTSRDGVTGFHTSPEENKTQKIAVPIGRPTEGSGSEQIKSRVAHGARDSVRLYHA